jgi:hypothetical protein
MDLMRRDKSHTAFERAKRLMPGGVNSPARAFGERVRGNRECHCKRNSRTSNNKRFAHEKTPRHQTRRQYCNAGEAITVPQSKTAKWIRPLWIASYAKAFSQNFRQYVGIRFRREPVEWVERSDTHFVESYRSSFSADSLRAWDPYGYLVMAMSKMAHCG